VKKAKNNHIKAIARGSSQVIKLMMSMVEDTMALTHSLVTVYPEQMSHWFAENKLTAPAIEQGFIEGNAYIFDHKNTKNYFLNGLPDWQKVVHRLFAGVNQLARYTWNGDEPEVSDFGDKTLYMVDWLFGPEDERAVHAEPKRTKAEMIAFSEELQDLVHNIETANKNFYAVNDAVKTRLAQLGIVVPTFMYDNVFPSTNWKVYYKYWDGCFEVTPLTIGPLLATQFSRYKSVTMVSGTFPPEKYIQAFWGISPYRFEVTEKIGEMEFCLVTGVSSKYQERESSYDRWVQTIVDVHEQKYSTAVKSTLVGLPSKEVMNKVAEKLGELWDPDQFWFPNEENGTDVNDMIDELNRCVAAGERKVFLVAMGSRFTEGVEYVDAEKNSMLDNLIACGIPYPGMDIHLDNMKFYAMEMFGIDQWGGFELINTELAFQKVRQLAGRGVRSQRDKVMVYLADNRYKDKFWKARMPYTYEMPAPELRLQSPIPF
jgi:Rad3-related DNA helicase